MSVFAGSGQIGSNDGIGIAASFNQPAGITIDANGNLFVTDKAANLVRKITKDGVVSTVAGSGLKGMADGAGTTASFNEPQGIAVDKSGNLYIADYGNFSIREILPDGSVSTVTGGGLPGIGDGQYAGFTKPIGILFGKDGALYVTDGDRVRKLVLD